MMVSYGIQLSGLLRMYTIQVRKWSNCSFLLRSLLNWAWNLTKCPVCWDRTIVSRFCKASVAWANTRRSCGLEVQVSPTLVLLRFPRLSREGEKKTGERACTKKGDQTSTQNFMTLQTRASNWELHLNCSYKRYSRRILWREGSRHDSR